jgi:hypothetical protein
VAAIGSLGTAALFAPAALALEPGVHINPLSPAGIQYSFPLGSARTELSGQPQSSTASSNSTGPLFGIGVTSGGVSAGRSPGAPAEGGVGARASARRLEATAQGGAFGDLVLPLVGGVLLAGVLGGLLGSVFRSRAVGP